MRLEWFKNDMNEKSKKVNGVEEQILSHEGQIFPLQFYKDCNIFLCVTIIQGSATY